MASLASLGIPPHSNNVDEELQRVRLAMNAVFGSQPPPMGGAQQWYQQRQLADRYLVSFQATKVAWMVCDRLLMEGDVAGEAAIQQQRRFFAAQTLHTKCRSSIYELPAESLQSLRDSFLAHLSRYASAGDMALTTRLALCISALAVQMEWTTIIGDLLQLTIDNARTVLLLVLRVLPEECTSDRLLLLDENKRYHMRDHLIATAPHVFALLQSTVTGNAASARAVLETFHNWVRWVPVKPESLVDTGLLKMAFQLLRDPQFMEYASDVVVVAVRMYPSHQFGNEALIQMIIPLLAQLPLDDALASQDDDAWRAYCRVFTEAGEAYLSLVLSSNYAEASKLVEWVLKCTGIRSPEIAGITLHFWYRMVADLETLDFYEFRQELVDFYSPCLLSLIDVCVTGLMKFPSDVQDLADDELEDLIRQRQYVSETIDDCCRLLGGSCVLKRIGDLFRAEINTVSGQDGLTEWQGIESCVACISAINRFVANDEAEILPVFFRLIPRLPANVEPLRYTASKAIGKFASWLSKHPQFLEPLLPYLAAGLSVPRCASVCAVAIRELCECSNDIFQLAGPAQQLYEQILAQPGRLDIADELQILEGVCKALSRLTQDTKGDGIASLTHLAQPIGSRLSASVADPSASPKRIIPDIKRLAVVVRHLCVLRHPPSNHPIVDLMSHTWPLLDAATRRFPHDVDLAEAICSLHKHALRSVGANAYAPVADTLMQQLVASFNLTHLSPFLYAASICITEYGHDRAYRQRLYDLVAAMSTSTFGFLRSQDDMTCHPDVVEEYLYLLGRMMGSLPDMLIQSQQLESMVAFAVTGMRLDHAGANKATVQFLELFLAYAMSASKQGDGWAAIERVISTQGQTVVLNVLRALAGDFLSYNNQLTEILWKLNGLNTGLFSHWLVSSFSEAPRDGSRSLLPLLPDRTKSELSAALGAGLARDEFRLSVQAFQSACERERRLQKAQGNG